eukprot:746638-Hanusia_phi.AAC.6
MLIRAFSYLETIQSRIVQESAGENPAESRRWRTLVGLSVEETRFLIRLLRAFSCFLANGLNSSFDLPGKIAFLAFRSYCAVKDADKAEGMEGKTSHPLPSVAMCYALHSDSQEVLLEHGIEAGAEACWLECWPALWVHRTSHLRDLVEKIGKEKMKRRQVPMDAALWYVLAGKVKVLAALFKASQETKVREEVVAVAADASSASRSRPSC